ncbi:hypothetical protein ACJJTC_016320 [Scirpophaga incertulas]
MFVSGERPLAPCAVMAEYRGGGWGSQCTVVGQWNTQPHMGFSDYQSCQNSVPFYRNICNTAHYYPVSVSQQLHPPHEYLQPQQPVLNLPCHQNQPWDYSTMCFNVDGQPCAYTDVVDLEDFM